jgi:hypothetical protein
MAFAASMSFPRDLVQAFSICYHFPAYSLVVHIEESMEQDKDTEFFDSRQRCFLGDKDIHLSRLLGYSYQLVYGMLAMVASNSAICWSLLPAI